MPHPWHLTIAKQDLIDAIGHARTRATLRRKGTRFEREIAFIACETGLSIRSSAAAKDIPAEGSWCSPIMTNGAALRRLAPKLAGPTITLRYEAGRLFINTASLPAREA